MSAFAPALALALALLPLAAWAESKPLLAKIEAVVYLVEVRGNAAKDCPVELKDVSATIKFYGGQSRLGWYDTEEERARLRKEAPNRKEVPPPPLAAGQREWDDWLKQREVQQRAYDRKFALPLFHLMVYPEHSGEDCMAFVHVGVSAPLRGARIAHTGVSFDGSAEIWDRYYYLKGSAGSLAAQVKDTAERAVRDFVNDWSDANR
ncbi:MAG: hypothetical protein ACHQF3_09245 [Alphaproteobacteria bacterium]